MKAIIKLDDVPAYQIGAPVRVYFPDSMMTNGVVEALELLKEQEPQNVVVKCEPSNGNILWFANCPKCGQGIERDKHKNHCGYCGQAVKWE